jgi:hypothetical protein
MKTTTVYNPSTGEPIRIDDSTPDYRRKCELCGCDYAGPTDAAGICSDCSADLGGGKYSARIVKEAVKERR